MFVIKSIEVNNNVSCIRCMHRVALVNNTYRVETLFVVDVTSCIFMWMQNGASMPIGFNFLSTLVISLVYIEISIWFIK